MPDAYTGRTVALTACPAWGDGKETTISGLFDVEEFCPIEPAAYVNSPCFTVVHHYGDDNRYRDDKAELIWFSVDADVLVSQVDPRTYSQMLEQERMMDFAEESFA